MTVSERPWRKVFSLVLVWTAPAALERKVAAGDFANLAAELGADYFCDPLINRPKYIQMVRCELADALRPAVFGAFEHGVINTHAATWHRCSRPVGSGHPRCPRPTGCCRPFPTLLPSNAPRW
jgi:hypothetical protein